MKNFVHKHLMGERLPIVLGILILVVFVGGGAGFYFIAQGLKNLNKDLVSSTENLSGRITNMEAVFATTSQELAKKLLEQENKANDFAETIDDISGTVGTLEKLSKTDKELLQKYSRVYFLSDNYIPLRLKAIDAEYLFDKTKELQFHASALTYLKRMLNRASDDNVDLKIVSAYRSFGTQSALKNSYMVTYGSGSNQFSADQGYSEHQLGTAVDLTTSGLSQNLTINFETTPAFEWLTKNAYKYGFVLSYPKGNAYYQYEPWHWRFVGVDLATDLHNDNQNFSDLDQREIDKYLVKIFD